MPVWGWVLIAIAVVAVVALIAWQATAKRRTKRLQEQFGPEYERAIEGSKNRREAESQLTAREKRREELDVRDRVYAALPELLAGAFGRFGHVRACSKARAITTMRCARMTSFRALNNRWMTNYGKSSRH